MKYEVKPTRPDILLYVEAENKAEATNIGFQKLLDEYTPEVVDGCYIADIELVEEKQNDK
jgi:hypothetical protein